MINNRQQNGRRRGRGGGGPRSPNMPSGGNRQDNRQRGNAAQLLEKYKSLARDAQLAGDRVQTETYLQFADHYFRVLSESRSRFEEQNPRRQQGDFSDEEDYQDEGGANEGFSNSRDDRYEERPERQERAERQDRPERQDRSDRQDRPDRQERYERQDRQPQREYREPREPREQREPRFEREPRAEFEQRADNDQQPVDEARPVGELRPRRQRGPRRDRNDAAEVNGEAEERIALEVLPPAIGPVDAEDGPRRRTRRPRPPEDEDIAPAA